MYATADSIVRRGEADMDQWLWMGLQQGSFGPDGDLYSRKGLGMTLLALPLVWLARWWPLLGMVQTALLLSPLLTAWTGALVYRSGIRLGWARSTSIAVALVYGLATMAWPYTQEFFSDPVCAWGLFAAFYGLFSFGQTGRKRYLVGGGAAWSLAYLARTVNLVTLPIFAVGLVVVLRHRSIINRRARRVHPLTPRLLLREQWRPMVSFVIPIILAGVASLWWNWLRYGSIWDSGYVSTEAFSAPWLFGILGLLVGPSRGLVWYNPILLLAIPGAFWFWRRAPRVLATVTALFVVYVLLYGKWYMWHGGYSWGPRFLVPMLPFLALLIGPVWDSLVMRRRRGWAGLAAVLLLTATSVAVQWLGMLIPFGVVQEWLAATVQPLFAPQTFTQLRYSPLLLQWRFLSADASILAWLRHGQIDWLALAMPLSAVLAGVVVLARQAPWHATSSDRGDAIDQPRNWLYGSALIGITLAMLTYHYRVDSASDNHRLAERIARTEQTGDAILHLDPATAQSFVNAYHGRLPMIGMTGGDGEAVVQEWLGKSVERKIERLWIVPDSTPSDNSQWERALRANHFLLLDTRPAGQDGRRLAYYALNGVQPLVEVGLGTIFGDPTLADQKIDANNGWFRLAGYQFTPSVRSGEEILLVLRWVSLHHVEANYQVFVHLLDADDQKLAQRDGQPVQWLRPTSSWQPGEEISDHYGILLPQDIPPGSYTIAVGLYDPVTGQRLPVSAGPGDFAMSLGPVTVRP